MGCYFRDSGPDLWTHRVSENRNTSFDRIAERSHNAHQTNYHARDGDIKLAVLGLAPSRKQNFGTKGLEIWIATGDYNGIHVEGQTVVVPAESTSFVYIVVGGGYGEGPYGEFPFGGYSTAVIQVGPTVPDGAYPLAGVVSTKVNCSGNTVAGIAPFVPKPFIDYEDGIVLIMDLRA